MAKPDNVRVLVVDDDDAVRESLGNYLDDTGFNVCLAASGEQTMTCVDLSEIDVAVIDLRLSGISGETLILRLHKIAPQVRFLIHTGSMDFRVNKELALLGVASNHVLIKPQRDLSVLVDAILALAEPIGHSR